MLASTAEPPHTTVYLACRVHFPGLGEEEGRYFTYKDSEQTEEGVGWGRWFQDNSHYLYRLLSYENLMPPLIQQEVELKQ